MQIEKEDLQLFATDTIFYIENLKELKNTLWELIHSYSRLQDTRLIYITQLPPFLFLIY